MAYSADAGSVCWIPLSVRLWALVIAALLLVEVASADPPGTGPGSGPGQQYDNRIPCEPDPGGPRDAECDDENECTDDWCGTDGFCHYNSLNGEPCELGICWDEEVCVYDECIGIPKDCDDENDCTYYDHCIDVPDYSGCYSLFSPPGAPCEPANPCLVDGECDGYGHCIGGEEMDCDDGNDCTEEACVDGVCEYASLADGAPCSDGDWCTGDDHCESGTCVGQVIRDCDDQDPCTDDVCTETDCDHFFNNVPCDDGDACTENDACYLGTCSGTVVDCDDSDACSGEIGCDPDTGCLYIWVDCDDDDPCTDDTCDSVTAECGHEDRWAQPDFYCGDHGCEVTFGGLSSCVPVNNDDDDGNGVADWEQSGPVADDYDFVPISLVTSGCPPSTGDDCPDPQELGNHLHLWNTSPSLGLYVDSTGQTALPQSYPWPPPGTVYVEGRSCTDACGQALEYRICRSSEVHCYGYSPPIRVAKVESLRWETRDETNVPLDTCPNNGGQRIFPGKLHSEDYFPEFRKQVKLVAQVCPPIADLEVHFKVWDVDDPFDQLHGPGSADEIVGVELVDGNRVGRDNRGGWTDPYTDSDETDETGRAEIIVTVSMQPGDNYRAGASLLRDAVDESFPIRPQATQAQADGYSVWSDGVGGYEPYGWWPSGWYDGYKCPLVWSQMLTVWRKLHVELDSMGPVSGNFVTGTILSIEDLDPQPRVKLGVPTLPPDFRELDHFHYGEITIGGFATFTTDATEVEGPDYVTIKNPEGVDLSGAYGAYFMLVDDDVGMLGSPPPLVFPRLADTGLMPEVYGEAYVGIEQDLPSQFNLTFDRNVGDQGDAYLIIDGSKNVDSFADFWAAHVVSAFQGYANRDSDPGAEEGDHPKGLLYGLTRVYIWVWRGGSMIFLETCRDKGGSEAHAAELERFNVAHEVGHQFFLEHADGEEYPAGSGSGTYIMMTAPNDIFPDNLRFSPKSLKKIREVDFPQNY